MNAPRVTVHGMFGKDAFAASDANGRNGRQLQEEAGQEGILDDVQCFSSIMIIGAQKSGRTVLLSYFVNHGSSRSPSPKRLVLVLILVLWFSKN